MRKLIDIPDNLVKDLKILAVHADKDLKTYIQELIIEHVKRSRGVKMDHDPETCGCGSHSDYCPYNPNATMIPKE